MGVAAFLGGDPWTEGPRWIVANMLLMTTLQFRDPVQIFILVETGDFLRAALWRALGLTITFHSMLNG